MGRGRGSGTVAMAALLLGVTACSDGDSSPRTAATTSTEASATACSGCPVYGEHDTAISAEVGAELMIELESNASTGYQWTATSSDETVVREQGEEYVPPSTDALGAPGSQRFVFAASAAGTATLTLQYSRSSEDGADAREIAYTVTVT